ncbi:hypothetical protein SH661x_004419 [Planctomicrobium sp. SH661]|uniref:hypothetical protein n=1 Tax=Planctomicrobium sp. SH661 TaxID=3448124 RepID=UPI003F5B530C
MTTELTPLERAELLEILREMLPLPQKEESLPDEVTRLIGGDPGDVVVDVGPQSVVVSEYTVRVESDTAKILHPLHLGSANWTKLPAWTTRRILGELTAAAMSLRRATYTDCIRCGKGNPPEEMSSGTVCRKCSAAEERIVY